MIFVNATIGELLKAAPFYLFGKIAEIVLYNNNRRSLIPASAGKVAKGADQICEMTGRGAFGGHAALQVRILPPDAITDRLCKGFAAEAAEFVVGKAGPSGRR